MSATALGSRQSHEALKTMRARLEAAAARMVVNGSSPSQAVGVSFVDLGDSARLSLMLTPAGRGPFEEQMTELVAALRHSLQGHKVPMTVTSQTVFLRDADDRAACERLLAAGYGAEAPVTNFVYQPPCCGAAVALEAWAIGGPDVRVERFGPHAIAVSYDSVRWVYCAGIEPAARSASACAQMTSALQRLDQALKGAGADFEHVVRTWFYLGGITEMEGERQRYQEMNRARGEFYRHITFGRSLLEAGALRGIYPASTGIGMKGGGLVAGCLALQTAREDAVLVHLENPHQTPAYAYHSRYSPQSPKFSRAMGLVLGNYLTTWVSGTASIVNSESRYPGDIERQTEQTIENIEQLISPANFACHGVAGVGASLRDLAKVRVYLKRPEDFLRCKAICDLRFGRVPVIYAVADVCRPELLVEIEGVAFSRCAGARRGQAPAP